MRLSTAKRLKLYLAGIFLTLLMWQLISFAMDNEIVMPGPLKVFKEVIGMLGLGYTWKCIGSSLYRCLLGFGISFVAAMAAGVIAGMNDWAYELLKPLLTLFKTIPTASLVFLFIVINGARMAPVSIVSIVAFPILYEGIAGGIRSIDQSIVEASLVDGSSKTQSALNVRLPLSLPYIGVAVASSLSLCFKIEIMSEVITGTTYPGLGSQIATVRRLDPANMIPVFAYSVIAIAIFMVLDGSLDYLFKNNGDD